MLSRDEAYALMTRHIPEPALQADPQPALQPIPGGRRDPERRLGEAAGEHRAAAGGHGDPRHPTVPAPHHRPLERADRDPTTTHRRAGVGRRQGREPVRRGVHAVRRPGEALVEQAHQPDAVRRRNPQHDRAGPGAQHPGRPRGPAEQIGHRRGGDRGPAGTGHPAIVGVRLRSRSG